MKYLRKYNEKTERSIEDWCKKLTQGGYYINDDNTVDVHCPVDIESVEIWEFPIQFNVITGHFTCNHIKLRTLKGSPRRISSYFSCFYNDITSLEGGPLEVRWSYDCSHNNLKSLEHSPKYLPEGFDCSSNNLNTLVGGPKEVGNKFFCNNNKLVSLKGCPDKMVNCHFSCMFNDLLSLEGCPNEMSYKIFCKSNPIYQIYNLFPNHESYIESLDYGYLRGENISKRRLEMALKQSNINVVLPKSMEGYKYIDL
jgi:hypothetical protein